MCDLSDYEDIRIYGQWRGILENELEMWHRDYLPVHGTVLDLGAGCGETVFWRIAETEWTMVDTRLSEACLLKGEKALLHWDCLVNHTGIMRDVN